MRLFTPRAAPSGEALVARPRLEGAVERLLGVPVSVVRAGAGFGKTTLLRAWAARLAGVAEVAWVTLEDRDASARALVEKLNDGLRACIPGFGRNVEHVAAASPSERQLLEALQNELLTWTEDAQRTLVLFVDDVHAIAAEESALTMLGYFAQTLAPRVHVVFASRLPLKFVPISRYRAAGVLFEIDEDELRFTESEAAELLKGDDAARAFVEQTEGWAIALGLSAQVLTANPNAIERALNVSRDSVFEFLAEEVTAHLSDELRRRLYVLAVPDLIDDRYAAPLLDVESIHPIVDELAERGLYVTSTERGIWRFHHLFRQFLLERFARADAALLRRSRLRYAELLRQNGNKVQALTELLDIGEYEPIVEYVHEALTTIYSSDRYKQFIRLLARVPDRIMQQNPMLHRFYAMALVRDEKLDHAETQLHLCYERANAIGDMAAACIAQMELGNVAGRFYYLRRGKFDESEKHFRRAVELAKRPELEDRPQFRSVMHWHLGMALAARGSFDEAFAHLAVTEGIERAATRHVDMMFVEMSTVCGWMGDWRRALDYAELAEELFRSGGGDSFVGLALLHQAIAHVHLNPHNDRCIEIANAALAAIKEHLPENIAEAHLVVARAALNHIPPSVDAANSALEAAESALKNAPNPVFSFDAMNLRMQLAMLSGRGDEARTALRRAKTLASANGDPWQLALGIFSGGMLELIEGRDAASEEAFSKAAEAFSAVSDRYYAALARLSALGCEARSGALSAEAVDAFFRSLQDDRMEYVTLSAPRSAASLLRWSLRNVHAIDLAEEYLGPSVRDVTDLLAIAEDAELSPLSRATAIRIAAKASPFEARTTVARLAGDGDPLVSGTARATLDYLPHP
ncbi:MAG: hypothetical protein JOZ38_04220, partial [Candidatus Eremiobacteraeota bacterium]|nr:hypothetical protein [Candidatus Eremiobacteraeota bacterium]